MSFDTNCYSILYNIQTNTNLHKMINFIIHFHEIWIERICYTRKKYKLVLELVNQFPYK